MKKTPEVLGNFGSLATGTSQRNKLGTRNGFSVELCALENLVKVARLDLGNLDKVRHV